MTQTLHALAGGGGCAMDQLAQCLRYHDSRVLRSEAQMHACGPRRTLTAGTTACPLVNASGVQQASRRGANCPSVVPDPWGASCSIVGILATQFYIVSVLIKNTHHDPIRLGIKSRVECGCDCSTPSKSHELLDSTVTSLASIPDRSYSPS